MSFPRTREPKSFRLPDFAETRHPFHSKPASRRGPEGAAGKPDAPIGFSAPRRRGKASSLGVGRALPEQDGATQAVRCPRLPGVPA